LSRRLNQYPRIEQVLNELDANSGGSRYSQYIAVFEVGLLVRNIGEVLMWLHDESDRQDRPAHMILSDLFVAELANPAVQHAALTAGFPNLTQPPPLLLQLIIREFEEYATEFELMG
jgi:hypothetical protein